MAEYPQEVRPGGRGFPGAEVYRALKLVVLDVDGTLTDGGIVLDENGVEAKTFYVQDGAGIVLARLAGLEVGLLTARTSKLVERRAAELKIPPQRVLQGVIGKRQGFARLLAASGVQFSEAAYVGDDLIDWPVLREAAWAGCPADARPQVREVCHGIAAANGGRGAVRQILEHLLQMRADGTWERTLAAYLGRES
ncbi:MAG: phenylphosphate carboxylase subunit delta [Planctomycetes bacterium]|nr:phenylphosphate carboxylase subunit delta [Planctomycetota bacterium]